MARLDYYGLMKEMQDILELSTSIDGVQIAIEEEEPYGPDNTPFIGISIPERSSPIELQRISAGRKQAYLVVFSVWCWCFDFESKPNAIRNRDDLLGTVEVELMKGTARTLNGKVESGRIDGGELSTATLDGVGFFSGGEIKFIAEATASY